MYVGVACCCQQDDHASWFAKRCGKHDVAIIKSTAAAPRTAAPPRRRSSTHRPSSPFATHTLIDDARCDGAQGLCNPRCKESRARCSPWRESRRWQRLIHGARSPFTCIVAAAAAALPVLLRLLAAVVHRRAVARQAPRCWQPGCTGPPLWQQAIGQRPAPRAPGAAGSGRAGGGSGARSGGGTGRGHGRGRGGAGDAADGPRCRLPAGAGARPAGRAPAQLKALPDGAG